MQRNRKVRSQSIKNDHKLTQMTQILADKDIKMVIVCRNAEKRSDNPILLDLHNLNFRKFK